MAFFIYFIAFLSMCAFKNAYCNKYIQGCDLNLLKIMYVNSVPSMIYYLNLG